jgi:hypothetical protein
VTEPALVSEGRPSCLPTPPGPSLPGSCQKPLSKEPPIHVRHTPTLPPGPFGTPEPPSILNSHSVNTFPLALHQPPLPTVPPPPPSHPPGTGHAAFQAPAELGQHGVLEHLARPCSAPQSSESPPPLPPSPPPLVKQPETLLCTSRLAGKHASHVNGTSPPHEQAPHTNVVPGQAETATCEGYIVVPIAEPQQVCKSHRVNSLDAPKAEAPQEPGSVQNASGACHAESGQRRSHGWNSPATAISQDDYPMTWPLPVPAQHIETSLAGLEAKDLPPGIAPLLSVTAASPKHISAEPVEFEHSTRIPGLGMPQIETFLARDSSPSPSTAFYTPPAGGGVQSSIQGMASMAFVHPPAGRTPAAQEQVERAAEWSQHPLCPSPPQAEHPLPIAVAESPSNAPAVQSQTALPLEYIAGQLTLDEEVAHPADYTGKVPSMHTAELPAVRNARSWQTASQERRAASPSAGTGTTIAAAKAALTTAAPSSSAEAVTRPASISQPNPQSMGICPMHKEPLKSHGPSEAQQANDGVQIGHHISQIVKPGAALGVVQDAVFRKSKAVKAADNPLDDDIAKQSVLGAGASFVAASAQLEVSSSSTLQGRQSTARVAGRAVRKEMHSMYRPPIGKPYRGQGAPAVDQESSKQDFLVAKPLSKKSQSGGGSDRREPGRKGRRRMPEDVLSSHSQGSLAAQDASTSPRTGQQGTYKAMLELSGDFDGLLASQKHLSSSLSRHLQLQECSATAASGACDHHGTEAKDRSQGGSQHGAQQLWRQDARDEVPGRMDTALYSCKRLADDITSPRIQHQQQRGSRWMGKKLSQLPRQAEVREESMVHELPVVETRNASGDCDYASALPMHVFDRDVEFRRMLGGGLEVSPKQPEHLVPAFSDFEAQLEANDGHDWQSGMCGWESSTLANVDNARSQAYQKQNPRARTRIVPRTCGGGSEGLVLEPQPETMTAGDGTYPLEEDAAHNLAWGREDRRRSSAWRT